MILKGLIDYDISNYKEPSMFLIFPKCSFKCDKESGQSICQNSALVKEPDIGIDISKIIDRYLSNPLTHAVVCGGLEPFDTFSDLFAFVDNFRMHSNDPIIIYTGYNKEEKLEVCSILKNYSNIIVKWGRFIMNQHPHYDKILGVNLASDN